MGWLGYQGYKLNSVDTLLQEWCSMVSGNWKVSAKGYFHVVYWDCLEYRSG